MILFSLVEKSRVVKTNPLAKQFWMRRMALCIYDAAIGRRMGIGMPFLFVTMTAISLSSIAKKDMTEASSIYTMTRAVGGNIGYALVATLIAGVQPDAPGAPRFLAVVGPSGSGN